MNKLETYIDKYKDLGAEEAAELESMVRMYPWFHGAHVLLAKSHKNQNRFSQKNLLKKASLYAGDRSILYQIMQDNWDQNGFTVSPIIDDLTEELPETQIIPEEPVMDQPVEEPVAEPAAMEDEVVPEEPPASEDISDETEMVEEVEPEIQDESPATKLEEAIQYDPIEALKDLHPESEEEPDQEQALAELIPDKPPYDPEKELLKLIDEEEVDSEEVEQDEEQPHDFGFWLDHFNEDESPKKDTAKSEEATETPEDSSHSTDKVVDLLDQFIKTKPKIKRQEREFFNAEKQGLKSIEDNSEIVTETLARLFLKQGHPSRAVDVYEKLRLQNPEKDAYFARLIEEIETE